MESYIFDQQLSDKRADEITARLVAFNRAHTMGTAIVSPEPQPLQIFALDGTGTVRAGLIGRTHAIPQWLEISIIYVDDEVRRQGLGRRLMDAAEAEALRRGCRFARLATSNFQAPGFYERLGYVGYGTLADCPLGETTYFYWKPLSRADA